MDPAGLSELQTGRRVTGRVDWSGWPSGSTVPLRTAPNPDRRRRFGVGVGDVDRRHRDEQNRGKYEEFHERLLSC